MDHFSLQNLQLRDRISVALTSCKARYFRSRKHTIWTLLFGGLMLYCLARFIDWAVVSAYLSPGTPADCTTVSGACWAFVWEKWSVIFVGAYPHKEIWRPLTGVGFVLAVLLFLGWQRWPAKLSVFLVTLAFAVLFSLLDGRPLGLVHVDMVRWHGIAVVVFLGVFSLFAALPLGILLALARLDGPPLLSKLAIAYIEVIRAIPLVTVLFFGVFVLPLLLPPNVHYEPLLVSLLALVLFNAAYFAEDVRGGLQAISQGQFEAGEALGMSYITKMRFIILPQALSYSIPAMTNTIIGGFKDTSLVAMVGIFDLLATTRMAYSDPAWQKYGFEGLFFIGVLYFIACSAISRHSRTMEAHVAGWVATEK